MTREIIYSPKAAELFDPLERETLIIEEYLLQREVEPGGRIRGLKPFKSSANGRKPKNSGWVNIPNGPTLVIHPEKGRIVVDGTVS